MLNIGVIGAGTMGALHARVVATSGYTKLAWVADPSEEIGGAVANRHGVPWMPEPDYSNVDAVVIAAPTEHHFALANQVLSLELPLLLEKPLALEFDESLALIARARESGTVMMCGLLERFNPAVKTATEIAREPVRVATVRHSPYSPRIRSGVTSDLIIHDADVALRLIGTAPVDIQAQFGSFHPSRTDQPSEDIVDVVARFEGGALANLSASRLSQQKVRSLTITELDRTIEVDLLRQDITVYRNGDNAQFDQRAGYSQQTIIEIPVIRHHGEPLQLQLRHFVDLAGGDGDAAAELDSLSAPHEFVERVMSASQQ